MRLPSLRRTIVGAFAAAAVYGGSVAATCSCTLPSFVTPPVSAGCSTADASGCALTPAVCPAVGTCLTYTNPTASLADLSGANPQLIRCKQDLKLYANTPSSPGHHNGAVVSGDGNYPVTVITLFTGTNNPGLVGFQATNGCTGSGTGNIDLIINTPLVSSGGVPVAGFGDDAFKFDRSAGCTNSIAQDDPGHTGACIGLNVAGIINAGPLVGTNHQDCVQTLGGDNVHFWDIRAGDFANGVIGCVGDGGALYINAAKPSQNLITPCGGAGQPTCCSTTTGVNCKDPGWCVHCSFERMVMVSCIHGLSTQMLSQNGVVNGANSIGSVADSIFRSNDCGTFNNPGPLDASAANFDNGIAHMTNDAPGWTFGTLPTVVTNVKGDRWTTSGCSWGSPCPGFNPANNSR